MKTLHFASIFVIVAVTAFACDDSEDRKPLDSAAGTSSHAGSSSTNNGGSSSGGTHAQAGTSNISGAHQSDAGSSNDAGAGAAGAPVGNNGGEAAGGADAGGADAGGAHTGGANTGGAGAGADAGGAGGASVADAGGAGGAGGASEAVSTALEIIGVWDDNYGGTQTITASDWNGSAILAYDNALNIVYAQNSANDAFEPNKFTKTFYTQPNNGSFYFCQIVYNADTLADAQASTAVVDASDPDNTGCGGFSWTKATQH